MFETEPNEDTDKEHTAYDVPESGIELVMGPTVLSESPMENYRGHFRDFSYCLQVKILLEQGQGKKSNICNTVLGHAGHEG